MVAGFMASEKVTVTRVVSSTFTEPDVGVREAMVGGVLSMS
jgi:hypothetical protein